MTAPCGFVLIRRHWRAAQDHRSMTITLYGIRSCDTMKKARGWLDAHEVAYRFHDYKTDGIDRATLARWCSLRGWEAVLNRAGTTFRKLDDADRAELTEARAIALMLAQPSMIKRPVAELDKALLIGFNPEIYAASFAGAAR